MNVAQGKSRIRAALVNSGQYSFDEAERAISNSILRIVITDRAAASSAGQAALLTAIATAVRCFGIVQVSGNLSVASQTRLAPRGHSLREVANSLGAKDPIGEPAQEVWIGTSDATPASALAASWDRWSLTVGPSAGCPKLGNAACALVGVASGALLVGMAFRQCQGDRRAGALCQQISLWNPTSSSDPGPVSFALPSALWLVGLGNLGQAFLWSTAALAYRHPSEVTLFLQDDDSVEVENWGTSVLARLDDAGTLKTRIAEHWLTQRGFRVRRIDRRLDASTRRLPSEPQIALAGLDDMSPRRLLGLPGFDFVIDVGLGADAVDYQKFRINVFDRDADPAAHYREVPEPSDRVQRLMRLPVYQELARLDGDAGCGAALLAGKAVAVPFVSAFAASLAISQAVRIASGEGFLSTITGEANDLATVRGCLGAEQKTFVGALALST